MLFRYTVWKSSVDTATQVPLKIIANIFIPLVEIKYLKLFLFTPTNRKNAAAINKAKRRPSRIFSILFSLFFKV